MMTFRTVASALVTLLVVTSIGCSHVQRPGALSERDRAELHLIRQEYAQALPLLESLHRAAPTDLALARGLTEAYVRTHQAQALITRLQGAPEGRPEAVTRYMLGLARFSGPAEADRAITDFEAAVTLNPSEPEFHYRLGLALLESERYERALPPLRQTVALAPDRHDVLLPFAKALFRTGDEKGAVEALRRLVQSDPTPDEVATARALMAAISDPFAGFPRSARGKLDEGLMWLQERDVPQQAIVAFEEVLRDFPDQPAVHALLGLSYQRIDDAGRAVEAFKRAIELSPDDGQNHLYLGLLYQSRQRSEQAIAQFQRALELHPLLDEAYFAVGDYHLDRQELPKAEEMFRILSHLQPQSPAARGKHALVLQLQGNWAAADRALAAILEKHPDNVEFLLRRGLLQLERRKQARTQADRTDAAQKADQWLRRVLELQPENALASRALQTLSAK